MNPQEAQLSYPFGEALPTPGHTLEVATDVRWVRMGLPFALDHINLWLLRDEVDGQPGWTAVDCGIAIEASRKQWNQLFAQALDGLPILRVLVTHMHPDHFGLAHWLCERWSAPLWISQGEFDAAQHALGANIGFGGDAAAAFYAEHGLTDPQAQDQVRRRSHFYASMVDGSPRRYHRLQHGERVEIGGRSWQTVLGQGHSPEHMALHCEDAQLLISGDMLLPRISTNVSVYPMLPDANPLKLFLESLERLDALPAQTLVLPSHGKPFHGLRERVAQLKAHHAARLADVLRVCAERPHSAFELLPLMFGRALDAHQTTFAMGEAVAHLHLLWKQGQLERAQGADGVLRFATPG